MEITATKVDLKVEMYLKVGHNKVHHQVVHHPEVNKVHHQVVHLEVNKVHHQDNKVAVKAAKVDKVAKVEMVECNNLLQCLHKLKISLFYHKVKV